MKRQCPYCDHCTRYGHTITTRKTPIDITHLTSVSNATDVKSVFNIIFFPDVKHIFRHQLVK